MKLTETSVAKIDPGNRKEVQIKDTKVTGFAVRVRRLSDASIRRDFLVTWQERRGDKRAQRKVFIGQHQNPWTVDDARREAQRLMQAREAGERVQSAKQEARAEKTVHELWRRFEADYLPGLKPKTAAEYRALAKRSIIKKFGRMSVSDVRRSDVRDWLTSMRSTPISGNRSFAVLSKMMAFAVEREWRDANPCIGVSKFKETARERWLDKEDLPPFLTALATDVSPYGQVLRFLTVSGWRVSEALSLTWEMVDRQRQLANLPDTKTGAQSRALSGDALATLEEAAHRTGFVFSNRAGDSPIGYKQVREALAGICSAAGISQIRPHDLRRTAATWAATNGATPHQLREAFGWKTLAMANLYAKKAEDLGREGVEKAAAGIRFARPAA